MSRENLREKFAKIVKNNLIVSCQALENEPLHGSVHMAKMAKAAKEGGCKAIRANGVSDIIAIKEETNLPIIGIIKIDYDDSDVYITPTLKQIDALVEVGVEVIALDATIQKRPGNVSIDEFVHQIRDKYPNQLLMADCSTTQEMIHADELGFDFIAPTLLGYTKHSANLNIADNDFAIVKDVLQNINAYFICEGNIDTPQKLKRVIELGCLSAVVGSSITRPQVITKKFVEALGD